MEQEEDWIKTDEDLMLAMRLLILLYDDEENQNEMKDIIGRFCELIKGNIEPTESIGIWQILVLLKQSVLEANISEYTKERVIYTLEKALNRVEEIIQKQI